MNYTAKIYDELYRQDMLKSIQSIHVMNYTTKICNELYNQDM